MERHDNIAELSEADSRALDALVENGFNASAVPPDSRERADKLVELLGLLNHLPVEKTGDLLPARTMQRIAHLRQQERFARQISSMSTASAVAGRLSLRDMVATAAMFLISMSLLWPVLSSARGTARQIACQANLAGAGMGLAAYAAANHGEMAATKLRVGDPWTKTNQFTADGRSLSNSAHLFQLVRGGYVPVEQLTAGHGSALEEINATMRDFPTAAAASFSYQNQYTSQRPKLASSTSLPIIADKNPFFENGRHVIELRPLTNSANHGSRGQNVLISDGRVIWLTTPVLPDTGDNIFHLGSDGKSEYDGTESPLDERDAFLVQ